MPFGSSVTLFKLCQPWPPCYNSRDIVLNLPTDRRAAGRPLQKHKARETAIKPRRMPRRYCEDLTSDSELADSNVDPFEEQSETESGNPIPVSLSVNDEPSPLQYRKVRSKAVADQSIDAKLAMEDDEDC